GGARASRAVSAGRRAFVLTVLGAALLVLTGVGLLLQHAAALGAFVLLALAQGAVYLLAVALTWRGGLSVRALAAVPAAAGLPLPPPCLAAAVTPYVGDGRGRAAGINPYRYVPAAPPLAAWRDETIFPNVNRGTYAPTIYPPVAELIFFIGTRVGETPTAMRA